MKTLCTAAPTPIDLIPPGRSAAKWTWFAVLLLSALFSAAIAQINLGSTTQLVPTLLPPTSWTTVNRSASTPLLGPPTGLPPSRSDRILVKPKVGISLGTINALLGVTVLHTFPGIGNLQVIQLPAGLLTQTVIQAYQTSGLIEYAEPDFIVHLLAEPNDFRYFDGSLWAFKNTGQLGGTPGADIKAPQGWDLQSTANNV